MCARRERRKFSLIAHIFYSNPRSRSRATSRFRSASPYFFTPRSRSFNFRTRSAPTPLDSKLSRCTLKLMFSEDVVGLVEKTGFSTKLMDVIEPYLYVEAVEPNGGSTGYSLCRPIECRRRWTRVANTVRLRSSKCYLELYPLRHKSNQWRSSRRTE